MKECVSPMLVDGCLRLTTNHQPLTTNHQPLTTNHQPPTTKDIFADRL
ncbi:hypothetical protein [Tolypothrix sp. VBCCA 56010]